MKRAVSNVLSYIFAACMCLSVFCFVIESVSFDVDFHYENVDLDFVKSRILIDDGQVKDAVYKVASYIKGETDDMQFYLEDGGYLFNERELVHMADVKNLFALCDFLKFACIGICMVIFIGLFAINGFYSFRFIARGCVMTMLSMIGIVIILGAWYMIDFSGFWTAFHKVAFTNDLWLMMPDDALIIFYTLEFFTAIVRRIIERLAVIFGVMFVAALIGWMLLPKEKGRRFGKKNFSY